jgi:hypothetical protein
MALATEEEEEPNQTIDGWIQISTAQKFTIKLTENPTIIRTGYIKSKEGILTNRKNKVGMDGFRFVAVSESATK